MPTIKIRKLTFDADDTFQAMRNFITLDKYGEIVVKDAMLVETFGNLESKCNSIPKLEAKIQEQDVKIRGLKKNINDSTGLNTKNWDLKKQIQEKDKETSSLQDKIKGFELEIQSLQDKNDTLNNTIQELQSNIESLQGERDKLSKELQKQEDIKTIFNRWGTYQSLQKDVALIRFFMDRSDTDVRQKKVIEWFRNSMDKTTVRKHLYGLVKKKILQEPDFKGTYRFNSSIFDMSRDMDRLAQLILGYELFEMAVDQHNKKLED
jgi:FtsZ-binding cell division protein ZapB